MMQIILLVLAAGAAGVDFYHRRVWLAIAVALLAIALLVEPIQAAV
jgi:heme exporter protein D